MHLDGQTPLDEGEQEGLLIPTIATRGELDEFEQQNIEQAMLWAHRRPYTADQVFTQAFIQELHRRMYGEVWAWAGEFRKTNKNLGCDKWLIATELKTLLDDMIYWYANHTYSPDEGVLRFKHRLVSIHCFANGNGRHSRLLSDIIIKKIYKQAIFSWGVSGAHNKGDLRSTYLSAIKAADNGDMQRLIRFARS